MFYFVYILQFDKSKKLYKGYTKNLKLRLEQHKKRLVEYTKDKGPLN
jgi:putative endonuclease